MPANQFTLYPHPYKSLRNLTAAIATVNTIRRWAPQKLRNPLLLLLDDIQDFIMYAIFMNDTISDEDLSPEAVEESLLRALEYLIQEAIRNGLTIIAEELEQARQNIQRRRNNVH